MNNTQALDPSGPPVRSTTAPNPRRCPANMSVSLRPPPTTTINRRLVKDNEGAGGLPAGGTGVTAEQWFQTANNNVQHHSDVRMTEGEPPFFLKRESSSSESAGAFTRRQALNHGHAMPHPLSRSIPSRAGLLRKHSSESSSEEYRSVIDDLTIENKKLKRKLRKIKKRTSSHIKGEKLIELTVHGLPAHKKRELEHVLKQFVSDIGRDGGELDIEETGGGRETTSSASQLPLDSGYGSNSASANASSGLSPLGSKHGSRVSMGQSAQSKDQKMRSYLDEIPKGLLPRRSFVMSDQVKKEMVVRRLEQLFTGKVAAVGGESMQTIQQEEISQSAATADRRDMNARNQHVAREGIREARILPSSTRLESAFVRQDSSQDESSTEPAKSSSLVHSKSGEASSSSGNRSPEQRPTRPLDLDPQRAQSAEENMEYIRHLRLSSPKFGLETNAEEDDGWVYLNLLMNMAQLHTINVTPQFVREAVADVSTKIDISQDGRKIRWRGGSDGTKIDEENASSAEGVNSSTPDTNGGLSGDVNSKSRKHLDRITSADTSRSGSNTGSGWKSLEAGTKQGLASDLAVAQPQTNRTSNLHYKPLFSRRERSSGEDDSPTQESDAPMSSGGNGGMTSSLSRHVSGSKRSSSANRKRRDGPIIFYNSATFCTDLTGDTSPEPNAAYGPALYEQYTTQAVGCSSTVTQSEMADSQSIAHNDPPLLQGRSVEHNSPGDEDVIMEETPLKASAIDLPVEGEQDFERPIVDFEASGIGGVRPEDNFVINVKTRNRSSLDPVHSQRQSPHLRQVGKWPSTRLVDPPVKEEIVGTEKHQLPPSELPPPSYIWFPFSSSDEGSSSVDSDDESSAGLRRPAGVRSPSSARHTKITMEDDAILMDQDEDEEMWDSDSSVDDFAQMRELLRQEEVATRERKMDPDGGARFDRELPAGSSAATAGGGSGYSSSRT